jgi:hypothetical protein
MLDVMHISNQRLPNKARFVTKPDVLLDRPRIAVLVGLVIATWADIEGKLEAIFLLCVRDQTALAEFKKIKGWDARSKFFVQSMQSRKGETLAIEVQAILRYIAKPANKRHDIAHGIFAVCEELPNDLVVASPEIYTRLMEETLRAEELGTPNLLLNHEAIFATARVVTVAHLEQLLAELKEANDLAHNFMIENIPEIVHVGSSEIPPRVADHPDIAMRIQNAKAGIKKRDKKQKQTE